MTEAILTLNTGSSSIKAALYPLETGAMAGTPSVRATVSGLDSEPVLRVMRAGSTLAEERFEALRGPGQAVEILLDRLMPLTEEYALAACGHRIVHGGRSFSGPVVLDDASIATLTSLSSLAPGHQPENLGGVKAARLRWPSVPQTASFDTAFHATCPAIARYYGLPREMLEDGIIRYGFHGLSYDYIAGTLPAFLEEWDRHRVIVAHLGSGASMCALKNGASIATTMGFTALDGLPMGTRCGDIDPGVLLYLLEEKGLTPAQISDCLYRRSGLLGLSGISSDMRELEASDAPQGREAIDYFVYRCGREIGSLTAALGGLDALVFTGGIGQNSALVRGRIVTEAGWLGFVLDDRANNAGNGRITAAGNGPSAWVVPTDEELVIARQAWQLVSEQDSKS
ncbi:acetate/propionate family kinase [Aquisalinus flavus]|uniref:Acetate kinase n=1 Tax=Aquisalinus flavus TaxID=1526572 RepID=A0A8J2V4P4_9PROT|nr:acetate/propionate family kinase [Aquisalinus flavus]MBD0426033.1 acetate/propionate family kinase [Aquisalinus flavus]UNE48376.1 acetate/propionate family kinase [Aquisalinus flavus]GGD11265.1 acetate kinase [Aquisalinus flavus]